MLGKTRPKTKGITTRNTDSKICPGRAGNNIENRDPAGSGQTVFRYLVKAMRLALQDETCRSRRVLGPSRWDGVEWGSKVPDTILYYSILYYTILYYIYCFSFLSREHMVAKGSLCYAHEHRLPFKVAGVC